MFFIDLVSHTPQFAVFFSHAEYAEIAECPKIAAFGPRKTNSISDNWSKPSSTRAGWAYRSLRGKSTWSAPRFITSLSGKALIPCCWQGFHWRWNTISWPMWKTLWIDSAISVDYASSWQPISRNSSSINRIAKYSIRFLTVKSFHENGDCFDGLDRKSVV